MFGNRTHYLSEDIMNQNQEAAGREQAVAVDTLTDATISKLYDMTEMGETLWLEVEPAGEENGMHYDGSGYDVVHLSGQDEFAYRTSTHSQDGMWELGDAKTVATAYVQWLQQAREEVR
jgi:hypothetical protein